MGELIKECPEGKCEPEYCRNTCPFRFYTDYMSSNGSWYYCRHKCESAKGQPITFSELMAMQRENKTGA